MAENENDGKPDDADDGKFYRVRIQPVGRFTPHAHLCDVDGMHQAFDVGLMIDEGEKLGPEVEGTMKGIAIRSPRTCRMFTMSLDQIVRMAVMAQIELPLTDLERANLEEIQKLHAAHPPLDSIS